MWVPHDFADDFGESVQELLPKGAKLYRRPAQRSDTPSNRASDGISTPSALTPQVLGHLADSLHSKELLQQRLYVSSYRPDVCVLRGSKCGNAKLQHTNSNMW